MFYPLYPTPDCPPRCTINMFTETIPGIEQIIIPSECEINHLCSILLENSWYLYEMVTKTTKLILLDSFLPKMIMLSEDDQERSKYIMTLKK